MRLLRLKIKNIASLKGEHEIDFQEIQRGSSLFAITGETGSGKSSVLNCIGLALYGEIYKKNINQLDVVTLGEKEGSIELIFQVKGTNYLADWRARVLKQNGEPYSTPQSPVRNLYKLEGSEFADPKNITTQTCSELLNLDFEQFCRCIILNQGEFAKFLNSSFKDRRDILEKMYPGEVLDNISRELETEKKYLEKAKHEVMIQLQTLQGDATSGEFLKKQRQDLEAELKKLEEHSKNSDALNDHFISMFSYHEKYAANERSKELIKNTMALETTKFNAILKTGEEIFGRYQAALKVQETELPLLQTYLKKEETLKHLEEGWENHKKKAQELTRNITLLKEKLDQKELATKSQQKKLEESQKALTIALKDLKLHRQQFDNLFELFSESELLKEELKGESKRLLLLETSGKEQKALVEQTEAKLQLLPANVKELQKICELKKAELSGQIDKKQRAEIKSQELKKQIEVSQIEIKSFEDKLNELEIITLKAQEDIFPIETTLKLQEVLNASEVCIDHALTSGKEHCPVCEQPVTNANWTHLKLKLAQTDLKSLRFKFEEGTKLLAKCKNDTELFNERLTLETQKLKTKENEYQELAVARATTLPTLAELDQELTSLNQDVWNFDQLTKDLNLKKLELTKFREQYLSQKLETAKLEKICQEKDQALSDIAAILKTILPELNRDTIRDLKNEVKLLNAILELEGELKQIQQDQTHLQEKMQESHHESLAYQASEDEQLKKIASIKAELTLSLKGENASELIQKINQLVKAVSDEWSKQNEAQKKQELILKDSQGRLYTLDELTKDFELLFTKEAHAVKELAAFSMRPELLKLNELSLEFSTPKELLIPLKELIQQEKESYKRQTNECRMKFASVATRLSDWEKLQDKIQLLELKARDINDSLARKLRLFEVLGKDELRTFVLSLVEENLIQQTNDELQKLCQGRYEIVHQTKSMKMTPEFFILDKFRDGGRRKVSTLSGGETFMVSLAMALGLAEMTRGQAEIDSLFIDEGFGTLDQDSLEDVLDMLQQIQTRGLMVGIISHIKTLTNALPVNLILNKRQDGTSSLSLQYN